MTTRDLFPAMESTAVFSRDRKYRWSLVRRWVDSRNRFDNQLPDLGKMVAFVGLNPSTADERKNDPTVTRCINYAKSWGYDGMAMLNAFAFRATDPRDMKKVADPVGQHNDATLRLAVEYMGLIVCCWGAHITHNGRDVAMREMMRGKGPHITHLGLTKDGHPRHPLYLRRDLKPKIWQIS